MKHLLLFFIFIMSFRTFCMNEDIQTPGKDELLIEALESGNTAHVLEMLAEGANPNSSAHGNTALTLAITLRNKEVIQALLARGADVNLESQNSSTPLVAALDREPLPGLIEDLLRRGANPNQHTSHFNPPLILAAGYGNVSLMGLLLEHNAHVDIRNSQQETPLHHATQSGSVGAVRLLLTHGADSTLIDSQGLTPIDWATNALSSTANTQHALEVVSAFTHYELFSIRDVRIQAFLQLRRVSRLPVELIEFIADLVDPRLRDALFPKQSELTMLLTSTIQEGSRALARWYMLIGANPQQTHVESALRDANNAKDNKLVQWFNSLSNIMQRTLEARNRNRNISELGNQPVIDTNQAIAIITQARETAHI